MAKTKKTKAGEYLQVDVVPSACPKCGCTERTPFHEIQRKSVCGVNASGFHYNRLSWKRTKCKNCQQNRIERIYENIGEKHGMESGTSS